MIKRYGFFVACCLFSALTVSESFCFEQKHDLRRELQKNGVSASAADKILSLYKKINSSSKVDKGDVDHLFNLLERVLPKEGIVSKTSSWVSSFLRELVLIPSSLFVGSGATCLLNYNEVSAFVSEMTALIDRRQVESAAERRLYEKEIETALKKHAPMILKWLIQELLFSLGAYIGAKIIYKTVFEEKRKNVNELRALLLADLVRS